MHNKKSPAPRHLRTVIFSLVVIVLLMQLTACSRKQVTYFQGSIDTAQVANIERKEAIIQKHDILSIVVFSDDPAASAIYNQALAPAGGGASGSSGGGSASGYLVNEQGDIYFQGLGKLHVEGLTKAALIDLLNDKLKEQLKNPYYAIRFVNYKITVQGEVNRGGEFNIPNERVTILEAIALAGDMTIYAKRQDVLVIREVNGKRTLARLDVTDKDIFNSPYYYMQQNDLVIVEPTKKKPTAERQETLQNIGLLATVISTLAIILTIVRN
jgi:polysaccharide biosynthesis/export protein